MNTPEELQAAAKTMLEVQGYTPEHAAKMARLWYPTAAQQRMNQARAARRNGTNGITVQKPIEQVAEYTRANGTRVAGYARQKQTSRFGPQTAAGKAAVIAATKVRNRERWARVKELGLRNLAELAQYDRGMRSIGAQFI